MQLTYQTQGTCSKQILIDVDDATRTIREVQFVGGCPGNTQGVAALVRGMDVDTVVERLEGIMCGMRGTSCPAQLATALRQAFGK